MARRRPAPAPAAPAAPTTAALLRAAEAVEGYDRRWSLLHPIMGAHENANETEYEAGDLEEDGTVRPDAWERVAASSLGTLLSDLDRNDPAVAWFKAAGFSW